jgi:hypothetical protein
VDGQPRGHDDGHVLVLHGHVHLVVVDADPVVDVPDSDGGLHAGERLVDAGGVTLRQSTDRSCRKNSGLCGRSTSHRLRSFNERLRFDHTILFLK